MKYQVVEISKRWFVVFECKTFLGISFSFWNLCKIGTEQRTWTTRKEAQDWINNKK